mgnify:CR=1 FL=1
MDDDDDAPTGAPPWMATFADLMSLLMCFFVLLLSFSEMDVQKYKQVAGSMKNAFGVQNQVKVMDIPKGTSIIAQEFSPGRPQPSQMNTVNQFTTETTKPSLRVGSPGLPATEGLDLNDEQTKRLLEEKIKALIADTKADAEALEKLLKDEIEEGKIDIETQNRSITIRIRERGSFPSGSATLNQDFMPVIQSLRDALADVPGKISIEGHSDDVPIASARFQSNWDLSAARALTVTHQLLNNELLDSARFLVVGHADTKPHVPNDSAENRAQNRRVEIVIRQGFDDATIADIKQLQRDDPDALDNLKIDDD